MLTYRDLLDYAEILFDDATQNNGTDKANAYLIGSILNSWAAIESFTNNMMRDFAALPEDLFTIHERGFLEEKQVRFTSSGQKAGTFCLENKEAYGRLEDKILFLIAKFGKSKSLNKGSSLWQRFEKIKKKRNILTHPRRGQEIDLKLTDAYEAIGVSKGIIELVSKEVWNKQINW